jgi:hypothetical protein
VKNPSEGWCIVIVFAKYGMKKSTVLKGIWNYVTFVGENNYIEAHVQPLLSAFAIARFLVS